MLIRSLTSIKDYNDAYKEFEMIFLKIFFLYTKLPNDPVFIVHAYVLVLCFLGLTTLTILL